MRQQQQGSPGGSPSGARPTRRGGGGGGPSGVLAYASLDAFSARLTVLLNAFAAVRRYTEVSPATRGKFLAPSVTAEYLRKRFYESLHGSLRGLPGGGAPAAAGGPLYDPTLNCGAVIVIHMFAKVAGAGQNPMALPLVQSLSSYLLSLPLFSLAETNPASVAGALSGGGGLSPEVVHLAVGNIFSLVEVSLDGAAAGSGGGAGVSPLTGSLIELATLLAVQRGVVHEVMRACRALLRCPHGLVSAPLIDWLQRNANALRPRKELPDIGKGLRIACEDCDNFYPTALTASAVKTQVLSVAYGSDTEGACSIYVHSVDGLGRWVEQLGRYEEAQHTRSPDPGCVGATRSSMAVTLTHLVLLTDRMAAEGVAVAVYTTGLDLHRVFSLGEMDASWPREGRANAQIMSGPEDQIILVHESHHQPAVHIANGAAAAAATPSAVLGAGGSIARAATRSKAAGVRVQGFLLPSFPRPSWTTALKAPSPAADFSLSHCLALRKPCVVDLGAPEGHLQLPAGHVTVEMWVTLLDKEDAATLYQHGDKGTTGEVFMEIARLEGAYCIRGGYRHDARGSCVVSAPLPPTAETRFFHVALVFDGRWHLFFDGEEVACNRQGPHVSLDAPRQRWSLCTNCTCLLAGLRVWTLGKSAREVARDHKRALSGEEPGLACQMFFNEYSGNVAFNYVASTRSRHAVCGGSFTHARCDNHPWRSFTSVSGFGGGSGTANGGGGGDGAAGGSGSSPHVVDVAPPRSAIHDWADLSLTRCFCYQGQLALVTQVSDAAPYALPSGRVFVFFDLHTGASASAFFYLTSRSTAHGFMNLDSIHGRVYELFDLDTDLGRDAGASPESGGGANAAGKVICLAQVPLDRDAAAGSLAAGPGAGAAADATGSDHLSDASVLLSGGGGQRPATSSGGSSAFLPSSPTASAGPAFPALTYSSLSVWLLRLLGQYAMEEPAQDLANLFSPLADDVGRDCSAEVQTTLQEHFRVVKGPSARRVVTLASPVSKEVIACALQVLLRLIRRVRAFGLHPASVGLNVLDEDSGGGGGAEAVNRLLRELAMLASKRRSSSSNSPLGSSSGVPPATTAVDSAAEADAATGGVGGGGSAGSLVGLLGDVINEAGKTLPLGLGALARTVIVEGIDLFIPGVRSRARLLREVLAVTATADAAPSPTAAAGPSDRVPALEALVDGTVESFSTIVATAALIDTDGEAVSSRGVPQKGASSSSPADVLVIAGGEEEDGKAEDPSMYSLGEARETLQVLIDESLSQLRAYCCASQSPSPPPAGLASQPPLRSSGYRGTDGPGQTKRLPGPATQHQQQQSPASARVRGVRASSLADAISSLQVLLLSACQGLPAEQVMNASATSQRVTNVFAMPRPAPTHRQCVRAYYGGLFRAAREGLGLLQRHHRASHSAAATAQVTEGLAAIVSSSFLAVPLHTAIMSIPLVVSVEEAPWFLRELEALLPVCDATREMLRQSEEADRGPTALTRNSPLNVLFDAALLSASWVAARMVRATGDAAAAGGPTAATAAATKSGGGADADTTADVGGGGGGAPSPAPSTSPGVAATTPATVADNPLLCAGVDLSLLEAVRQAAAPAAKPTKRPALPSRSARRAAVLALLRANRDPWSTVQKRLDALGARVTEEMADVLSLAALTCLYLSTEASGRIEAAMPAALRRLIPLRNHLLEQRAKASKEAFAAALRECRDRCCVLLCATNALEASVTDGDIALAATLRARGCSKTSRVDSPRERWRRAAAAVRGALRARTANALDAAALTLTHAIVLVSTTLQSERLSGASLARALHTREACAQVRLQGLEQLLVLMRKEPSCTEGIAQLLSTEEPTAPGGGGGGPGADPAGQQPDRPASSAAPSSLSLSQRVSKAAHFEAGIDGCSEGTRQRLRAAMGSVMEWLMQYQHRGPPSSNATDGDPNATRAGAADRLPFLCAFLYRQWGAPELDLLRRLRLTEDLFGRYCSLFPGRGSQPPLSLPAAAGAAALRMPSAREQQHLQEVATFQSRLAARAGTADVSPGTAPGSPAGAGSSSTSARVAAKAGGEELVELHIVPTAQESAKRAALSCLKQLGLQCATLLSISGGSGGAAALSRTDHAAVSELLVVLVDTAAAELRACLAAATAVGDRIDRDVAVDGATVATVNALRDQVQMLASLLAVVFRALDPALNFCTALCRATVSCAAEVYRLIVSDLLVPQPERDMPFRRMRDAFSGGEGKNPGGGGGGSVEASRGAAYARLLAMMLRHCSPAAADAAFNADDLALMCAPYYSWDRRGGGGATLAIIVSMVVDCLQSSGLCELTRSAVVAVRELLASRPRWAAQLGALAGQFRADLQNTALDAHPSTTAAAPGGPSPLAERALLSFKAYAWSTMLGGCALFVPTAGMRVRVYPGEGTEEAEAGNHREVYLLDVPAPGPAPPAPPSADPSLPDSLKRPSERVTFLRTTRTITEAMSWEDCGEDAFTSTTRGNTEEGGVTTDSRAASRDAALAPAEEQLSQDCVFLPPLSDATGHALPPYARLVEEFIAPAVAHFFCDLSDADVRGLNNVEVAALVSFTHLVLAAVVERPDTCAALLDGESLLAVSRFAYRAEAHHPLPLPFLKEFAALALSGACEALTAAAAASPAQQQQQQQQQRPEAALALDEILFAGVAHPRGGPAALLASASKRLGLAPATLSGSDALARRAVSGQSPLPGPFLSLNASPAPGSGGGAGGSSSGDYSGRGGSPAPAAGRDGSLSPLSFVRRQGSGGGLPPAASPGLDPLNVSSPTGGLSPLTALLASAAVRGTGATTTTAALGGSPGRGGGDAGSVADALIASVLSRSRADGPAETKPPAVPAVRGEHGFAVQAPLPRPTTSLCFYAPPASAASARVPAAVTITPRATAGPTSEQPSFALWSDGITIETSLMLCDRIFPQLGDDYAVPALETVDDRPCGRPAISLPLLSLYANAEEEAGGGGRQLRLLHVCVDGGDLVCSISPPGDQPNPLRLECRIPLKTDDWDRFLYVAVFLDDTSVVLAKGSESVSLTLPPTVTSKIALLLGPVRSRVDRLVLGDTEGGGGATTTTTTEGRPPAVLLDDCSTVLVTGLRMWGTSKLKAKVKTVAEMVSRMASLPHLTASPPTCYFDFQEGAGAAASSVDGSFAGQLSGHVRWVTCQLHQGTAFADGPDRLNVGSPRRSPGGGNHAPPGMIPRSELCAFFAGLDATGVERVGNELLWTLVARLSRIVVAAAMERCLSVDYKLHQLEKRRRAAGPPVSATPSEEEVARFPFDPFMIFDGGSHMIARQLANVFRYSDVAFLPPRTVALIRDFTQYAMQYILHEQQQRGDGGIAAAGGSSSSSSRNTLAAFTNETGFTILQLLDASSECFVVEIGSAGTAGPGRGSAVASAPVMPLALINGGQGALHFDARGGRSAYEAAWVYKDRGLKSLVEKFPDTNGACQPCPVTGGIDAPWVFVKVALLTRGLSGASRQPDGAGSAMASFGVSVRSLQPAIARVIFGAIADACTSGVLAGQPPHGSDDESEEDSAAPSVAVDALSRLFDANFIASLVQLCDSQARPEASVHAAAIAAMLMDMWRQHPRLKPHDHCPLHIMLAHLKPALVTILQSDSHGYESCGELSPTLGSYACFTQTLFEVLVSAVRLEEAWMATPHPVRVRSRWERLLGKWRACARYVPVAPAESASPSSGPITPLYAPGAPRRMSLAGGGASLAVAGDSSTASTPPPIAGSTATHPPPLSATSVGEVAQLLPPACHGAVTGAGSSAHRKSFGSISTTMDGALPPFEMSAIWPPQLRCASAANGSSSSGNTNGSNSGGSVTVKGNGEWLLRCERGSVTARSTIGFMQGRYYFEVRLPERPLINASCNALVIGLVTARSNLGETGDGVGQDGESWGFDGSRLCRVHQGYRTEFATRAKWKSGDVLGVYMDLDAGRMSLVYYDRTVAVFERLQPTSVVAGQLDRSAAVFFPAVTVAAGCACEVNFGAAPFAHGTPPTFLPASPQHYCGPHATKFWALLVAADWARRCRAATGVRYGRGMDQMTARGPGSGPVNANAAAATQTLAAHPAFGIFQRHIRETCSGRCGPLGAVDFLTSTSRLREGVAELQTDELPCVVRGGVAVRKGKWYYEVMVRMAAGASGSSEGTVTVGWAVVDVDGDWNAGAAATGSGGLTVLPGKALGDDEFTWVLEGRRMIAKHNKHQVSLGRHVWRDGDVIGSLLDCDEGTMRFTINGRLQRAVHDADGDGVLFRNIDTLGGAGLSPAIAVDAKMSVVFLWNQEDLKFPPIDIIARDMELAQPTTTTTTTSRRHAHGGSNGGSSGSSSSRAVSQCQHNCGQAPLPAQQFVYRAIGGSNVLRDAVTEYFMGTSADCGDADGDGGPACPTAATVSLHTLERVLRYISQTTDLNPSRLSAYCLYSLLGLKSTLPTASSHKGARAVARGVFRARGASTTPRHSLSEAGAAPASFPGSNTGHCSPLEPPPPPAEGSAAVLGLTAGQLRAALEQLDALSAAAEAVYRFGQDGRIPCEFVEAHHSLAPLPLHAALLALRRFSLPYIGLRALRRFLAATEGPGDRVKLLVNRRRALAAMRPQLPGQAGGPSVEERVTDSLFGQVYHLLAEKTPLLFCTRKNMWSVSFFGEGADDVGGPYRESLSQMCAELMQAGGGALPLFVPSTNQTADVGECRDVMVVNPAEGPAGLLGMYRFVGRLLGSCLRGSEPLSLYLSSTVWKLLVGDLPDAGDLARVDQPTLNALQYIERLGGEKAGEGPDEELAALCPDGFTAQDDAGRSHALVSGGRAVLVTARTAGDYAALALRFKLLRATWARLHALREGFHQVVPLCGVCSLKWYELEELVCGQRDYDADGLLDAARYEGLEPDDGRVLFLRQALKDFTRHQRAMFMRFVSGRERLPPGMRLKIMADATTAPGGGSGGIGVVPPGPTTASAPAPAPRPHPPPTHSGSTQSFVRAQQPGAARVAHLTLQALETRTTPGTGAGPASPSVRYDDTRLPHASTCFYWLSLPRYSSLAVTKERLLFAIEQCIDIDADFRVHDEDVARQEGGEPQLARATAGDGDEQFEDFSHLR